MNNTYINNPCHIYKWSSHINDELLAAYIYIHIYKYIHMCTYNYINTNIYTYIWTYLCKYICIHVHTYIYIYRFMYTHTHTHTYIYIYIYIHICIYIYIYIYIYMYSDMHICIYIYVYLYIHVYVYMFDVLTFWQGSVLLQLPLNSLHHTPQIAATHSTYHSSYWRRDSSRRLCWNRSRSNSCAHVPCCSGVAVVLQWCCRGVRVCCGVRSVMWGVFCIAFRGAWKNLTTHQTHSGVAVVLQWCCSVLQCVCQCLCVSSICMHTSRTRVLQCGIVCHTECVMQTGTLSFMGWLLLVGSFKS